MIFYVFYKFAVLNLIFSFRIYIWVLGMFLFLADRSLAGLGREQREGVGRIPARPVAGGEVEVAREDQEFERYLGVVLDRLGVAGRVVVGERQGAAARLFQQGMDGIE